eukprot:6197753-Pleurochrysis_carterae.AAC.2
MDGVMRLCMMFTPRAGQAQIGACDRYHVWCTAGGGLAQDNKAAIFVACRGEQLSTVLLAVPGAYAAAWAMAHVSAPLTEAARGSARRGFFALGVGTRPPRVSAARSCIEHGEQGDSARLQKGGSGQKLDLKVTNDTPRQCGGPKDSKARPKCRPLIGNQRSLCKQPSGSSKEEARNALYTCTHLVASNVLAFRALAGSRTHNSSLCAQPSF